MQLFGLDGLNFKILNEIKFYWNMDELSDGNESVGSPQKGNKEPTGC